MNLIPLILMWLLATVASVYGALTQNPYILTLGLVWSSLLFLRHLAAEVVDDLALVLDETFPEPEIQTDTYVSTEEMAA